MFKSLKFLALSLMALPLVVIAPQALAQNAPFKEGVHYSVIHQGPATTTPEITEFFSLGCPACRMMEQYVAVIKAEKAPEVKFTQSHVEFVGGKQLGPELAKAWAIAELLNVEEQVKQPLYQAVQVDRTVRSADDIRRVFIDAGVNAKEFDAAQNSFMLNGKLAQMRKAATDKQIQAVPTFVINGKYQVLTKELTSGEQLTQLVLWLTEQK